MMILVELLVQVMFLVELLLQMMVVAQALDDVQMMIPLISLPEVMVVPYMMFWRAATVLFAFVCPSGLSAALRQR
jgi:hypothetical protein